MFLDGEQVGEVNWALVGEHNMHNGLMAIAATRHVGVQPADACRALGDFINARRRLELRGEANGVTVYDDFAHHPTAILATLAALRGKVGGTARILAVLEPRSNTMKMGISKNDLAPSLGRADEVFLFQPHHIPWQVAEVADACVQPAHWSADLDTLVDMVVKTAQPGDHILVMSNGGFGGIHDRLLDALAKSRNRKSPTDRSAASATSRAAFAAFTPKSPRERGQRGSSDRTTRGSLGNRRLRQNSAVAVTRVISSAKPFPELLFVNLGGGVVVAFVTRFDHAVGGRAFRVGFVGQRLANVGRRAVDAADGNGADRLQVGGLIVSHQLGGGGAEGDDRQQAECSESSFHVHDSDPWS